MRLSGFQRSARRLAITAGLEVLSAPGLAGAFANPAARGIILTLHHVRPAHYLAHDPNAHLSVTPEYLDGVIRELGRLGHVPVRLDDVPALLAAETPGPKFFAMTLDDGNRDNARYAAPVFRRNEVPYTIFLTKGFIERTRTIWWETAAVITREVDEFQFDFGQGEVSVVCRTAEQKKRAFDRLSRFVEKLYEDEAVARIDAAARRAGIDPMSITDYEIMNASEIMALAADPLCSYGAHTVTHCDLARVSPERLADEIAQSADAVEKWTGKRPKSFAYPYGFRSAFGEREENALIDAGIKIGVTTRPGVLDASHANRTTSLQRISLNGYYQKIRYIQPLASGAPFRLVR